MLNEAVAPTLSNEDRKLRINKLLHQIDAEIKSGNLENALEYTRQVYSFDKRNLYARAFEERIQEIREARENEKTQAKHQTARPGTIPTEVKQHVQQVIKEQEKAENHLRLVNKEQEAIGAPAVAATTNQSVAPSENDGLVRKQLSIEEIERGLMQKIHTLLETKQNQMEEKLQRQLSEMQTSAIVPVEPAYMPTTVVQQYPVNNISTLLRIKEQQEEDLKQWLLTERARIQDELSSQLKEEQEIFQAQLVEHLNGTYAAKLEEQSTAAHQQALTAYRSTLALLFQYKIPKLVQQEITRAIRNPLQITDKEHEEIERQAQVDLYTRALRDILIKEALTPVDIEILAKQRTLYAISEEEHKRLTKQVKRELGLVDESAIICLVDDDPVVLTYMASVLKQTYITVLTAENAQAAAQLFEKTTPNLIICDVNMPGIGGFAFYENIQHGVYGKAVRTVPFIFASSLGDNFIINGAKQLGAKAYLVKPVAKDTLQETVKEALL